MYIQGNVPNVLRLKTNTNTLPLSYLTKKNIGSWAKFHIRVYVNDEIVRSCIFCVVYPISVNFIRFIALFFSFSTKDISLFYVNV